MVRLAAQTSALLVAVALFALPAFGRDPASLGDLQIPVSRVPDWGHLDHLPLDTSAWTEISVPCNGGDPSQLRSLIRTVSDFSILVLPANCHYNVGDTLPIQRSNIVVRGTSRETTVLEFSRLTVNMLHVGVGGWPIANPFGVPRAWTAAHNTGDRVLTVEHTGGLSVGGFVRMTSNPEPDWDESAGNRYAAKLVCVGTTGGAECAGLSANQIRVDRGLPMPFARGNQVVEYIANPVVRNVGVENLRVQHTNPSAIEQYRPFVFMQYCHECWITDSSFGDGGNSHIVTDGVVRSVFRGNDFGSNQCTSNGSTCNWNKGAIYFNHGDSDVVFENNSLSESPSGPLAQGGASTVIAYNYMRSGPEVECERHVFLHGQGVSATLTEGNDVDCMIQWDSYREGQGYNNTFYRNRLRGTGNRVSGYQRGRLGGEDTSTHIHRFISIIANHVNELMGSPQMTGRAIDESFDASHRHQDTWVSYNTARREILFEDSGVQVRTTQHENFERSSPATSWQGFNFPESLYRTEAPPWWCEESGPFPNIGSPSDAVGGYSRLPAQIRLEGGTCTTSNGTTTTLIRPVPPVVH